MLFKKLADLANKLDTRGLREEADQIDAILKDAGLMDWLTPKQGPACTCECDQCEYGRSAATRPQIAITHHNQCGTGKCEIKAAAANK
jgi:hypothetical protein